MFKMSNKNKLKKFVVKLCPNCNSDNVGVAVGGKIGMWECHKCGYHGSVFPEVEVDEEEFLKQFEENVEVALEKPKSVEEKKVHKKMLKENKR